MNFNARSMDQNKFVGEIGWRLVAEVGYVGGGRRNGRMRWLCNGREMDRWAYMEIFIVIHYACLCPINLGLRCPNWWWR